MQESSRLVLYVATSFITDLMAPFVALFSRILPALEQVRSMATDLEAVVGSEQARAARSVEQPASVASGEQTSKELDLEF